MALTREEASERTRLLPRRSSESSRPSIASFLKWHATTPLPEFSSPAEMPSAYVLPLTLQCVLSGLADTAAYSLTKSWLGFMTGNLVQVVIYTYDVVLPSESNHFPDAEIRARLTASCSALVGYTIGCQVTSLILHRFSARRQKRSILCLISIWRSLLTFVVVLLSIRFASFRLQASLSWLVIALLSTSLGSQAVYTLSLATPFANTVVFTASMTEVASDPYLSFLQLSVPNRYRLTSIFGLLKGAALSQTILKVVTRGKERNTHSAVQHALFVLSALELSLALTWYCCGLKENWTRFKEQKHTEAIEEDHDA